MGSLLVACAALLVVAFFLFSCKSKKSEYDDDEDDEEELATAEQIDSIRYAIYCDELEAARDAVPVPFGLMEDATAEDSAVYAAVMADYQRALADVSVDSTTREFRRKVDAAVAEFERHLNDDD